MAAPPPFLHLTGPDVIPGDSLGHYALEAGRTVHGSPVWKQVGGTRRIARMAAGNWGVQQEENVGQNRLANMRLAAPQLLYPSDRTDKAWQVYIDGAWTAQPEAACVALYQLPPPPVCTAQSVAPKS